jgi:hypothetical protein
MKRIFLLLILGLAAGTLMAAPKGSTLIIKANGTDMVSVAVGNMPFSDAAGEVAILNLKKGRHFIRVMRHTRGLFRTRSEMVYEGYITMGRKREVVAFVDNTGKLVFASDEKIKKNRPYYDVSSREKRRNAIHVTVKMDRVLSVF